MSNIYIQEPPTNGKVLLETTVGDIDVELWCKETPKACRNFMQLCMEGYYNGTTFHRVVRGFIAQGGDPTGTGEGGESIYGATFKDEFHSRLRFSRRGLLAMANAGRDDNGSQFFFTLAPTPELQNKHTIFGKVTGNTLYNMLKLEEGMIEDERPQYPQKILRTEVLLDPLGVIPRHTAPAADSQPKETKPKSKSAATKNFKLLSFGDEAEEDEDETIEATKKFSGKSKSSHDLTDDPKLSSAPAVPDAQQTAKRPADEQDSVTLEELRKKLKKEPVHDEKPDVYRLFQEDDEKKAIQLAEVRSEFAQLKKDMIKRKQGEAKLEKAAEEEKEPEDEAIQEYKAQKAPFEERKKGLPKPGASSREAQTMALLEKFKSKLHRAQEEHADTPEEPAPAADGEDAEDDESWMWHKLHFTANTPTLAKDASSKADDWYDIYDPRNEMNKRRRQADARRGRDERRTERGRRADV
ncbi:spliceosome-associated protein CWC27 homolog [Pollicipes pollicipes]|uniref:spliceosome-associated protein CWC27 homolog n=1 Tax=Pollicipes pollicipes TaxID=41117 RepID=UPI00188516AD|nr:spliceosome-associated protein CWC27 homolog [Pollicipes pollicipes]XP_037092945.1 spliceosome-associated protein CWC27 homolog [Pollicipes pollicipes]XP_037092946.1 spliceosome-associated protein CWC27 homolog [Pollicipes pollicipes]